MGADALPNSVRVALADCESIEAGEGAPEIDPDWGEPGLSPSEKVFGWCSFEVLAFTTGNPENPVNAIPPHAKATCQIRFVVGVDPENFLPALRRHLDATASRRCEIERWKKAYFPATRLDPDHPWVRWAAASIRQTTGKTPRSYPISAARCRTRFSPTTSACRPCGCRIPTPPVRSTRPTNTCWRRLRARRCR